jgi:glycerophosphoryl diester phosphodiesterase
MRAALIVAALLALTACDSTNEQVGGVESAAPHALAPTNLPAFFDCLRERHATIVTAHRGGAESGWAENSIEAFEHTLSQAPAFMEVDISRTRDGVLALLHDDTVDRTTNGEGAVDRMSAADFAALRLKDAAGDVLPAHPPTLREALDWARGRTVLELDVKPGVSYEELARAVDEAGAMNRVIFVVYSVNAASRLARVAPAAMIGVTISNARDLDTLESRGVDLSHIVAWTGTDEPNSGLNVALAARGVEASFGTIGHWDRGFADVGSDQYAAFAETGLASIATNRPVAAVQDLDRHDGAQGYSALQCVSAH